MRRSSCDVLAEETVLSFTLSQINDQLGGTLKGDGQARVQAVRSLNEAGPVTSACSGNPKPRLHLQTAAPHASLPLRMPASNIRT